MFILTPKFKKINAFNQLIKTLFEQGFFFSPELFYKPIFKNFQKVCSKICDNWRNFDSETLSLKTIIKSRPR